MKSRLIGVAAMMAAAGAAALALTRAGSKKEPHRHALDGLRSGLVRARTRV